MSNAGKRELEEKEKDELRKEVKYAQAVYDFIEKEDAMGHLRGDSERFMPMTFMQTKTLVAHSITLTKLTRWLIGLTIALTSLSITHIILLILR